MLSRLSKLAWRQILGRSRGPVGGFLTLKRPHVRSCQGVDSPFGLVLMDVAFLLRISNKLATRRRIPGAELPVLLWVTGSDAYRNRCDRSVGCLAGGGAREQELKTSRRAPQNIGYQGGCRRVTTPPAGLGTRATTRSKPFPAGSVYRAGSDTRLAAECRRSLRPRRRRVLRNDEDLSTTR